MNKNVKIGSEDFELEIASSEAQKTKGLMFRKSIPKKFGMLFLFKGRSASFHMKNTLIPLDILYVDNSHKIIKIESMMPQTGHSSCESPIYYAIELNFGSCKEFNINVGDFVTINKQNKYKKNLRESFEDIEKMKLRIRVNLEKIRFLDILTHIRGIKDVITVTADGQLEPAPEGKNMSNLFVRFENSVDVDVESILQQIKSIEGIDIVKVVEYDGHDLIKSEDKVADKHDVVKAENLIRKLVKETLRVL